MIEHFYRLEKSDRNMHHWVHVLLLPPVLSSTPRDLEPGRVMRMPRVCCEDVVVRSLVIHGILILPPDEDRKRQFRQESVPPQRHPLCKIQVQSRVLIHAGIPRFDLGNPQDFGLVAHGVCLADNRKVHAKL